jgi:hypothetical protein
MTTWASLRLGEVAANFAKFTRPLCKPALSPFPFVHGERPAIRYQKANVLFTIERPHYMAPKIDCAPRYFHRLVQKVYSRSTRNCRWLRFARHG